MQNDRICVSNSQPSLNRSTNNCPVVTGNCLSVHHRHLRSCHQNCPLFSTSAGTQYRAQQVRKGTNSAFAHRKAYKNAYCAQNVYLFFVYDWFSKRFWPCWTFCNRLVFYAELSGHKSPGVDQIPEELIQSGDGKTPHKINKPINVICSNKELQNSESWSCQPCYLYIRRVQQFSRHITFVNCVRNSIQRPAVKVNFICRQQALFGSSVWTGNKPVIAGE
jgi:hypothetical protein